MPRLRYVHIWPDGGRRGHPWVEGSRGADALARTAAAVCRPLSECLRDADVRLRFSTISIGALGNIASGDEVELTVISDRIAGAEIARIAVPDSVADLDTAQLTGLALEVLIEATRRFEEITGESQTDHDNILKAFEDHGVPTTVVSPWKSSPNRKQRARWVTSAAATGKQTLWLEVSDRGSGQRRRSEFLEYATPLAEAPTWRDGQLTQVAWLDDEKHMLSEVEVAAIPAEMVPDESWPANLPVRLDGLPHVRTIVDSQDDPELPNTVSIGLTINGNPKILPPAFKRAWRAVVAEQTSAIELWWSQSDWAQLAIALVATTSPHNKTSTHKYGRDLSVDVVVDLDTARTDPAGAALAALQTAVDRAARRAKLPPLNLTRTRG